MNSTFPLFNILLQDSKDITIVDIDKEQLMSEINDFDIEDQEIVYIIILMYSRQAEGKNKKLPYSGKKEAKTIQFNLESMPDDLIKLLRLFSDRRMSKQIEDGDVLVF